MMTIGQFNDSYLPIMDGVVNVVNNYAYWINKKYGESIVVTPKFPKYHDSDEFKVIRYPSTRLPFRPPYRLGLPKISNKTKRQLTNIDFDLIHVHSPFSSGKLGLKIARKKGIPIIATFHTKFYDDFKPLLKSEYLTQTLIKRIVKFYENCDYVWTVNESTAKTLKSYGFTKDIEIMPNGCDFTHDFDFSENKVYIEKNYNIGRNELVFLFVGQHIWQKNLKLLIDALGLLKQNKLDFKMIFIGEGYAKNEMISLVNKYNLTNEVKFIGKLTDRSLLKRFFGRSDLFLFPSIYDNAPLVIREAAALQTPSVVIEGANAQEGITDCVNGYTCKENATDLCQKILLICQNRIQLKEVGKVAQETISCSWENIINQVGKRYHEIIMNQKNK